MVLTHLKRVRWAVRATLILGVAASVVANVLHALDNPISQTIAAWPPLALLLTVELISRVPVHRRLLAAARLLSTVIIAGIAAWVSYWHMVGVASKYGEVGASPYLLPLSVDGLIVVASICLVELGGRIAAMERTDNLAVVASGAGSPAPATHRHPRHPDPASSTHPDQARTSGPLAPDDTPASPDAVSATTADDTKSPDAEKADTAAQTGPAAAPLPDPAGSTAPSPASDSQPHPDRPAGHPAGTSPGGPPRRRVGAPAGRPTPVSAGAGTNPGTSRPSPAGARAAARATQTALAHRLDEDPATAEPGISLRSLVYQLLDANPPSDALTPPKIADHLLPQLHSGGRAPDRDTVVRYTRLWRQDVAAGRRGTAGRLRAVPVPARH